MTHLTTEQRRTAAAVLHGMNPTWDGLIQRPCVVCQKLFRQAADAERPNLCDTCAKSDSKVAAYERHVASRAGLTLTGCGHQTTSGLPTAYPVSHGTMYSYEQIAEDPFVERVEIAPHGLIVYVRNGLGSRDLWKPVAGVEDRFCWTARN